VAINNKHKMGKNRMQIMDDKLIQNNHLLDHFQHLMMMMMMKKMYKEKQKQLILLENKRMKKNF
jgi:hypothetical protein